MNKFIVLFFLSIMFSSCKSSEKENNKLAIAQQYFYDLDNSNFSKINVWFGDSLITKEGDYKLKYTQAEYLEFLKWDSVFSPNYKVLKISERDEIVYAKISKNDKRILLLNEEPFITDQTLKFHKDKIASIQIDYANFDEHTWESNLTNLLNWIKENHPELNSFLFDQTVTGGTKYLKAITLYNSRK